MRACVCVWQVVEGEVSFPVPSKTHGVTQSNKQPSRLGMGEGGVRRGVCAVLLCGRWP